MGKGQLQFFNNFLLVLTKLSFWKEEWALDYNSMEFEDFFNILRFPKILSLIFFGNSYTVFITNNHDSFHM